MFYWKLFIFVEEIILPGGHWTCCTFPLEKKLGQKSFLWRKMTSKSIHYSPSGSPWQLPITNYQLPITNYSPSGSPWHACFEQPKHSSASRDHRTQASTCCQQTSSASSNSSRSYLFPDSAFFLPVRILAYISLGMGTFSKPTGWKWGMKGACAMFDRARVCTRLMASLKTWRVLGENLW